MRNLMILAVVALVAQTAGCSSCRNSGLFSKDRHLFRRGAPCGTATLAPQIEAPQFVAAPMTAAPPVMAAPMGPAMQPMQPGVVCCEPAPCCVPCCPAPCPQCCPTPCCPPSYEGACYDGVGIGEAEWSPSKTYFGGFVGGDAGGCSDCAEGAGGGVTYGPPASTLPQATLSPGGDSLPDPGPADNGT